MKFSCLPHPLNPSIAYPLVTATVRGPAQAIELRCLVDSGADIDSFPVSVAKEIGIPVETCPSESIIGIGGQTNCSYKTEAQFLEPIQLIVKGQKVLRDIPPLLGRKNTFCHFKIIFDEANKELELIPYQK